MPILSLLRPLVLVLLLVALAPPAPAVIPLPTLGAIVRAEDERDGSNRDLLRWIDDPNPEIRERIALALGRIGQAPATAVLIRRLRGEPAGAVRGALCFALGLIGRQEATKVLVETLAYDPDLPVRCRAAQALGSIAGGLPVGALLAALPPPGFPVDEARISLVWYTVIGLLRQGDERATEPLMKLATARVVPVARAAVWALARLKKAPAIPALSSALSFGDPFILAWAIRGLGNLKAATAWEVLPLLVHPDPLVRIYAIGASGSSKLAPCTDALLTIARNSLDNNMRIEAVNALGLLGGSAAIPLLGSLRVGPGALARAADLALARIAAAEGLFFSGGPALSIACWTILDWLGWVEALAARGESRARQRLSRLSVGLDGPAQGREIVAAAAVGAIANDVQPPEAATLGFHLFDRDPYHRAAVVESFVKHRGTRALPAVRRAYQQGLLDPIEEFRSAAVQSVADLGSPEAAPFLHDATRDRSRNVRRIALTGLARLAGATHPVDPGFVEAGRPLSFYQAAVARGQEAPVARVVTTAGTFEIDLNARAAPLTVDNFVRLAASRYFDGLFISRVVPGFVVQLGDSRGDMSGSPGYTIRCEVSPIPYERGTVGMALSGKDTGGAQFFVTLTRQPHLDAAYTVFGRVDRGMGVVDRLMKGDRILSIRVR